MFVCINLVVNWVMCWTKRPKRHLNRSKRTSLTDLFLKANDQRLWKIFCQKWLLILIGTIFIILEAIMETNPLFYNGTILQASPSFIEDLRPETKDRIKQLNALWCSFVCSDHHKDRDCHFELRLKFSEKESPKWLALHTGYIYDMPPGKFDSLAEAANYLVQNMEKAMGRFCIKGFWSSWIL